MTRFERDKDIIFDILAKYTGVGIGDNRIYYCNEIYCENCSMESACNEPHKGVLAMHKWLEENFEKWNEDIVDYIYDTIAVDKRSKDYVNCDLLNCRMCLFNSVIGHCTALKKVYLHEEV